MNLNIALPPKIHSFFAENPNAKTYVLYGGRMSGKTWSASKVYLYKVLCSGKDGLVVREVEQKMSVGIHKTFKDVIEGDNFLSTHFDVLSNIIRVKKQSAFAIYHKRIARIDFGGLKGRGEGLKGLGAYSFLFIDEAVEITEEQATILRGTLLRNENIVSFYCFNPRLEEDWVYDTFVKQAEKAKAVYKDKLAILKINWYDNTFLSKIIIEGIEMEKKMLSSDMYAHHYDGDLLVNTEGALFKKDDIINAHKHELDGYDYEQIRNSLVCVVIGVDPAVSTGELSDLTGIVVCGYNQVEKRYYVLEDLSGKYEPAQWGSIVDKLYEKWKANKVIAEGNQGGNMISSVLKTINPSINHEIVHARYGKHVRAEPIAALYQSKVVSNIRYYSHNSYGEFNSLELLERQMITYSPYDNNAKSPDRMDAMVYAMTYLLQFARPQFNTNTLMAGFGKNA